MRQWVSTHRLWVAVIAAGLLPVPGTWTPVAAMATRIVNDGGIGVGGHTGVGLGTLQGLLLFCLPLFLAYTGAVYLALMAVTRYVWGKRQ